MFCVDLRTNSYYFPIQDSLTGFYNGHGSVLTLYVVGTVYRANAELFKGNPTANQICRMEMLYLPGHTVLVAVLKSIMKETPCSITRDKI